jgi:hypothetical protein
VHYLPSFLQFLFPGASRSRTPKRHNKVSYRQCHGVGYRADIAKMGWLKDVQKLQWKDLDPTNKNGQLAENLRDLDKQVLQPLEQATIASALIAAGMPTAAPIILAYWLALAADAPTPNKLPLWLKLALQELNAYPDVDLTKVAYHEKSKLISGGITIG